MKLTETPLAGAFVVAIEQHRDDRGFFGRSFCVDEFQGAGIPMTIAQCNVSFNHRRGTLRGMHFQIPPNAEAKLVRCTRGAIYDVIVDLRPKSPTYTRHFGVELTAANHRSLYVPPGFAHGFQTLEDDAEVFYQMSEAYSPAHARGLRWNDPALGIQWPLAATVISKKDETYDDFAG
ncbi:MAG TPA: dTDP-4-dehydrorhamnose 3,5-epimerase [Pirellulales bacterium]|jgi:dTDP-4-dehydrorhamnose 3,5-epimerase|nr:dTDP-4-dehydrorhamnose 3,5-epimerase [Pirellulales bacterium]